MTRPVDLTVPDDASSPPAPSGSPLAEIEALLDAAARDPSGLDRAEPLIEALIAADPGDAAPWFLQARLLAARGQTIEAQEACRRAIALWPDILPAYRLMSDLAGQDESDNASVAAARRVLLAYTPDDAILANRIASSLCVTGDFAGALPYLRMAAPVLGHQDNALWNYTTSLAVTGGYHELLAIEPMLAAYARDVPSPFGPFVHLANAKLAHHADRPAVLRDLAAMQASARWLDAARLAETLAEAIAERRPTSVVLLSEAHARLVSYASLRAHLLLTEPEMSAVVNSVWSGAFGGTIESHGPVQAASLCRRLLSAIESADVIALPDANHLDVAHEHFGFLAETQRIAFQGRGAFTGLGAFAELHQAMPYLRSLLANQPFLGIVGFHPDLAERLARFAQIAETVTYPEPVAPNRGGAPEAARDATHFPAVFEQICAGIIVPYPGAIFLVGAGPLGTLYCGRVRELGGIAIDINTIVTSWLSS